MTNDAATFARELARWWNTTRHGGFWSTSTAAEEWAVRFDLDRQARMSVGDATLTACPHVWDNQRTLVMTTWEEVVACIECSSSPLQSDSDHPCDGCRTSTKALRMVAVNDGRVVVIGALCDSCMATTLRRQSRDW